MYDHVTLSSHLAVECDASVIFVLPLSAETGRVKAGTNKKIAITRSDTSKNVAQKQNSSQRDFDAKMEPAELRAINRFGTARSSPGIDAVRATHLSAIGSLSCSFGLQRWTTPLHWARDFFCVQTKNFITNRSVCYFLSDKKRRPCSVTALFIEELRSISSNPQPATWTPIAIAGQYLASCTVMMNHVEHHKQTLVNSCEGQ